MIHTRFACKRSKIPLPSGEGFSFAYESVGGSEQLDAAELTLILAGIELAELRAQPVAGIE